MPLIIALIDCIFAVERSLISVDIIGVPEATAASKNTETLFALANSKISFPWEAIKSLFAVIIDLFDYS